MLGFVRFSKASIREVAIHGDPEDREWNAELVRKVTEQERKALEPSKSR